MHAHPRARARARAAVALAAVSTIHPITASAVADPAVTTLLDRLTPPDGFRDAFMTALAEGRVTVQVPPLRAGQVVPGSVRYGYAIQGTELDGFDVTDSPQGRAEIAAYALRLQARGEPVPAGEMRAYSLPDVVGGSGVHVDPGGVREVDPDGVLDEVPLDTTAVDALTEDGGALSSVLVVPACAPRPELVGALLGDDGLVMKTVFAAAPVLAGVDPPCDIPQPTRAVSGTNDTMYDEDAWTPVGGHCWYRKSNSTAWYDPCYQFFHRTNDGDPDRDTFALTQWGTGKSKGVWELNSLEVEAWREKGTPDQDWKDWSPRADQNAGNCRSTTVGVNINAAYIERAASICEEWRIEKHNPVVHFANRWHDDEGVSRKHRETAMFMATSVPNGYVPHDIVSYDYYAWD